MQCAFALVIGISLGAEPARATDRAPAGATIVVATKNSAARSKAHADLVADGIGDQEEINAAIRRLPEAGGTVLLMEGTYDIRKVSGELGGVILDRSRVILAGQGPSTRLVQASGQNTNVIRIIGSGVGDVTIRDMHVDANRDENTQGRGDPDVSHDRFEFCGIKAYCQRPGESGAEMHHDITIRNTIVTDAHRLGIMLEGRNMKVVDNRLGNAGSDSVEILTGPGEIRGNTVVITGRTHVAIGTDRADSIIMADNIVHVRAGGDLDIAFRSWAGSHRHVIAGNVVTVDAGGRCRQAMDVRGFDTVVTGNNLHTANADEPLRLTVTGAGAIVTGNVLDGVRIEVNDQTGTDRPILLSNNLMTRSRVEHKQGKLVAPTQPQ